jgi:DNA primase
MCTMSANSIRVPLLYTTRAMPAVDYAAVRRAIPMARVLELLQFAPTECLGDQLRGPCPLHGSKSTTSRSFSVNLAKNAFRCFVCGAAGNQLDLWCQASQLPLYEAAIDLCDRLHISVRPVQRNTSESTRPQQRRGTRTHSGK